MTNQPPDNTRDAQVSQITPVLGIDLGDTVVYRTEDGGRPQMPKAFETIRHLREKIFGNNIYIVSRVTKIEDSLRLMKWLNDNNFFELTGVLPANVNFCLLREEKAPICKKLGVTHFVDDRPEVLSYMTSVPHRFLFKGIEEDYQKFKDELINVVRVQGWEEIGKILLS